MTGDDDQDSAADIRLAEDYLAGADADSCEVVRVFAGMRQTGEIPERFSLEPSCDSDGVFVGWDVAVTVWDADVGLGSGHPWYRLSAFLSEDDARGHHGAGDAHHIAALLRVRVSGLQTVVDAATRSSARR